MASCGVAVKEMRGRVRPGWERCGGRATVRHGGAGYGGLGGAAAVWFGAVRRSIQTRKDKL